LLIDLSSWDEIYEVFGDGRDYEWALVEDDENYHDIPLKPDTTFQDVGSHLVSSVLSLHERY
jgi:transcription elongation factor SPT6